MIDFNFDTFYGLLDGKPVPAIVSYALKCRNPNLNLSAKYILSAAYHTENKLISVRWTTLKVYKEMNNRPNYKNVILAHLNHKQYKTLEAFLWVQFSLLNGWLDYEQI